MTTYRVPIYRVSLVRESTLSLAERPSCRSSADAAQVFRAYLGDVDREHFMLAMLDAKNKLIGIHTVSVGTLTSSLVHPREVLKPAILSNSAALLLAHNHPSGDPAPSQEDLAITRRIRELCELLGIRVLDHVILGEGTRYVSFVDDGFWDR